MARQVRLVGIDLSTDDAKRGIVAIDLDASWSSGAANQT